MPDEIIPVLDPWDQQAGEPDRAYHGFQCFIALGPRRSLRSAYRKYSGDGNATHVSGTFWQWSKDWEWDRRANEWDLEQRRMAHDERVEHARKAEDLRIRAYSNMVGIGLQIVAKAVLGDEGEYALTPHEARQLLSTGLWALVSGSRGLQIEHQGDLGDVADQTQIDRIQIYIPDNKRGDRT